MHENGTVEQVVHYYPFGGTYADAGLDWSLQMYKYNGKNLAKNDTSRLLPEKNLQELEQGIES